MLMLMIMDQDFGKCLLCIFTVSLIFDYHHYHDKQYSFLHSETTNDSCKATISLRKAFSITNIGFVQFKHQDCSIQTYTALLKQKLEQSELHR